MSPHRVGSGRNLDTQKASANLAFSATNNLFIEENNNNNNDHHLFTSIKHGPVQQWTTQGRPVLRERGFQANDRAPGNEGQSQSQPPRRPSCTISLKNLASNRC